MESPAHKDHILPLWLYLKVGLTLLAMTILTVWVAQYHLGPFNMVVAMIIAIIKGTLVAMYFMHLKYANKLFATVFVGSLMMLAVFIVFTMFDTLNRGDIYELKARPFQNKAIIYQQDSAQAPPADTLSDTSHSAPSAVDSGH